MFGRESLLTVNKQHQLQIDSSKLNNAVTEWLFFGTYAICEGVAAQCGEKKALRDAILDEFFEQFYAGLREAGVPKSELPHVENCVRARFVEYRAAMSDPAKGIYSLGFTLSKLMFGEAPDATSFIPISGLYFADSMEPIKKLFDTYKIGS